MCTDITMVGQIQAYQQIQILLTSRVLPYHCDINTQTAQLMWESNYGFQPIGTYRIWFHPYLVSLQLHQDVCPLLSYDTITLQTQTEGTHTAHQFR